MCGEVRNLKEEIKILKERLARFVAIEKISCHECKKWFYQEEMEELCTSEDDYKGTRWFCSICADEYGDLWWESELPDKVENEKISCKKCHGSGISSYNMMTSKLEECSVCEGSGRENGV